MKKRSLSASLRPNGILRWSTACVLAGSLAGCERENYTATHQDAIMANLQTGIEKLDSQEGLLKSGLVPNNFDIPGVGYYHAAKGEFFQHPYNFHRDGKWFVNGEWTQFAGPESIAPSRPVPAALAKVDQALSKEQQNEQTTANGNSGGGFGFGNMLMMYWLLSGNRGFFSPGAGFQQAQQKAGNWTQQVNRGRTDITRHASANPGYSRMVEQSRVQGRPVQPGQTIRGGFGSSRGGGGFTSGS